MIIVGKKWIVFMIIASLLLGFTGGMVTDHIIKVRQKREEILEKQLGYDKEFFCKLAKSLSLSQTQAQAIGGILRLEAPRIIQVAKLFRNTMKRIRRETFSKIEEYLTEEQRIKFHKFLEETCIREKIEEK